MRRLFLLRHARAGWPAPGQADIDRPLAPQGLDEARRIGNRMAVQGYLPDTVFCSPALRARDSWALIAPLVAEAGTEFRIVDALYGHHAADYLAVARGAPPATASLLILGHNPMIEDFAAALAGGGGQASRGVLSGGFPTAGLAVFRLPGDFAALAPGDAMFEAMLTPALP